MLTLSLIFSSYLFCCHRVSVSGSIFLYLSVSACLSVSPLRLSFFFSHSLILTFLIYTTCISDVLVVAKSPLLQDFTFCDITGKNSIIQNLTQCMHSRVDLPFLWLFLLPCSSFLIKAAHVLIMLFSGSCSMTATSQTKHGVQEPSILCHAQISTTCGTTLSISSLYIPPFKDVPF